MKRLTSSLPLALFLLLSNPSFPQWERDELPDGSESCLRETGERILLDTRAGNWASRDCKAFDIYELFIQSAEALGVTVQLGLNPDGTRDMANPCLDGSTNCKSPAASSLDIDDACVTSAMAAAANMATGTGASIELASCRTGTNGASGVFTENSASWSMTTGTDTENTVAVNSCGMDGSGTVQFTLTFMTDTVVSEVYNWSCVTPAGGETQVPNPVTGLEQTGSASGTFDIAFDPSQDPGTDASGLSHYNLYINGMLETTISASIGLVSTWTVTDVGSTTGTDTCTPSGAQLTVVGGGAGFPNGASSDQFGACTTSVSGSTVTVIARISSLTQAATFPKTALQLAGGTATDSASFDCSFVDWFANTAFYVQSLSRLTSGGNRQQVASQNIATAPNWPRYRKLEYTNGQGSCYWSNDGTNWTQDVTDFPISLPSSKTALLVTTPESNGTQTTAVADFVTVASSGQVTATITTSNSGTCTITAEDNDGNESVALAGVACAPGAPPSGSSVTWNPGWYKSATASNSQSGSQSARFALFDSIANEDQIEGAAYYLKWRHFESDTQGNYTSGIAQVQADLDRLQGHGKQLFIRLNDISYAGLDTNGGNVFPTYLSGAGCLYDTTQAGGSTIWRRWNSTCMDYYIAMVEAICENFDDHPAFEGFALTRETAPSLGSNPPGDYSAGSFITQHHRLIVAAKAACPTTNVVLYNNWTPEPSRGGAMAAFLRDNDSGYGAPDLTPDCTTSPDNCSLVAGSYTDGHWGTHVAKGNQWNGSAWVSGGEDFKGQIPIMWYVEASEMGLNSVGPSGGYIPVEFYDYAETLGITHLIVVENTFTGTSDQRWSTGWLPFIQDTDNALSATACPSVYPSCAAD